MQCITVLALVYVLVYMFMFTRTSTGTLVYVCLCALQACKIPVAAPTVVIECVVLPDKGKFARLNALQTIYSQSLRELMYRQYEYR